MTGCLVLNNVVTVARKNGKRLPCEHLQAENKTLRELAEALADCRNTSCDDCVRWDYPQGGCTLDGVMRELGIEVPE